VKKLHQSWTGAEDRRLLELVAKGKALCIVAAVLKRSTSSVKGRLGAVRNARASSGAKIGTLSGADV
jgi:hypothetical protein